MNLDNRTRAGGYHVDPRVTKQKENRDPWNRGAQFYRDLQEYVGFDATCSEALANLAPVVEPHVETVVASFYEALGHNPHTRGVFEDDAQIERLRKSLSAWLRELFTGPHDYAYFQRRWQIGKRHVSVGLLPHFMFGAMNVVRRKLYSCLSNDVTASDWGAIERALDLDPDQRRALLTEACRRTLEAHGYQELG